MNNAYYDKKVIKNVTVKMLRTQGTNLYAFKKTCLQTFELEKTVICAKMTSTPL